MSSQPAEVLRLLEAAFASTAMLLLLVVGLAELLSDEKGKV